MTRVLSSTESNDKNDLSVQLLDVSHQTWAHMLYVRFRGEPVKRGGEGCAEREEFLHNTQSEGISVGMETVVLSGDSFTLLFCLSVDFCVDTGLSLGLAHCYGLRCTFGNCMFKSRS